MNKLFETLIINPSFRILSIGMIMMCIKTTTAHAQDIIGIDDPMMFSDTEQQAKPPIVKLPQARANQIRPLFWNADEINLINQIKMGLIEMEPIDEREVMGQVQENIVALPKNFIAPREIVLSGILYSTDTDWVVWINGMRVTPKKMPDEIRSINVNSDFVELHWFDVITDKIYPLRIRPYQKFSIDLRTFLPG